jgi:hypothetical protein
MGCHKCGKRVQVIPRRQLLLVARLVLYAVPAITFSASALAVPVSGGSTNQVELLASGGFDAMGSGGMAFDFVNRGDRCRIAGYPRLSLLNKNALTVDNHDVHISSMLFSEPRQAPVTIRRGGVATFGVSGDVNPIG